MIKIHFMNFSKIYMIFIKIYIFKESKVFSCHCNSHFNIGPVSLRQVSHYYRLWTSHLGKMLMVFVSQQLSQNFPALWNYPTRRQLQASCKVFYLCPTDKICNVLSIKVFKFLSCEYPRVLAMIWNVRGPLGLHWSIIIERNPCLILNFLFNSLWLLGIAAFIHVSYL